MIITSPQNPFVKKVSLLLRDGRYRAEEGLLVLEGEKAVLDAMARGHRCRHLIFNENKQQPVDPQLPVTQLANPIFEKISLMKHSTGVMGLFAIPTWSSEIWEKATRQVAVLDAVQSPQNVGAIIRNAAAFGVEAVLLLPGCADPTHPEVLRASSGYALDVPLFRCTPDALRHKANHFSVWILSAEGQRIVGKDQPDAPCLWVLGNEGQGPTWHVSHALSARIPMMSGVESLNVGVASGICFYAMSKAS